MSIRENAVSADIIVPQGEYAFATDNPIGNDTAALARARDYLAANLTVTAPDGRAWTVALRSTEFVRIAGPPDLHAVADFTPWPTSRRRRAPRCAASQSTGGR